MSRSGGRLKTSSARPARACRRQPSEPHAAALRSEGQRPDQAHGAADAGGDVQECDHRCVMDSFVKKPIFGTNRHLVRWAS